MNKELRRSFARKNKVKINFLPILVGDKVKLDIKQIRSQQDFPKNLNPKYLEWINENNKKFFTVISSENGICELSRDDEIIPWTFWEGHLKLKR